MSEEVNVLEVMVLFANTTEQRKAAHKVAKEMKKSGLEVHVKSGSWQSYVKSQLARAAHEDVRGYIGVGVSSPVPQNQPNRNIKVVPVADRKTLLKSEVKDWNAEQMQGVVEDKRGTVSMPMYHYLHVMHQQRQAKEITQELSGILKRDPDDIEIKPKDPKEHLEGRTACLVKYGRAYFDNGKNRPITAATARELRVENINDIKSGQRVPSHTGSKSHKR